MLSFLFGECDERACGGGGFVRVAANAGFRGRRASVMEQWPPEPKTPQGGRPDLFCPTEVLLNSVSVPTSCNKRSE